MSEIRFQDGAGYETMMGVWSRLVGRDFLDWVRPAPRQKWLDVGCGNGAFTEFVIERCDPSEIVGLDPSEAQLTFARQRPACAMAQFLPGSALALPFPAATFDIAAGALVIFFMPDPALGVAEMARVVRPGGIVSTYAWDLLGGGFPYEHVERVLRSMGAAAMRPPHPEAADLSELTRLWTSAGLEAVETTTINVERRFDDFESYWQIAMSVPGVRPVVATLPESSRGELKRIVDTETPRATDGSVLVGARAHAVKGLVPLA